MIIPAKYRNYVLWGVILALIILFLPANTISKSIWTDLGIVPSAETTTGLIIDIVVGSALGIFNQIGQTLCYGTIILMLIAIAGGIIIKKI